MSARHTLGVTFSPSFLKPELFFRSSEAAGQTNQLARRLALSCSSSNPYTSRRKFFNVSRQKLIASHLYMRETCGFLRLANPFGHPSQVRSQLPLTCGFVWPAALQTVYVPDAGSFTLISVRAPRVRVCFYNPKKKNTYFLGSRCLRSAR